MKKTVSLILVVILILSLFAGCSAGGCSINGIKLSEFTIVYSDEAPDYTLRAAQYIQAQIKDRTGLELPLCEDSTGMYPHEIQVGQTDRPLSEDLVAQSMNMEFYFKADDNHIAMNGAYFIIAAAAYYFVETYIPDNSFKSTIPTGQITVCQPITEKANNFIFLIGDGMGFNHTKLFDAYDVSMVDGFNDGEDVFYGYYLPYQGKQHTNSLSGTTDSAASATALACGYKTINGYIGRDQYLNDVQSLTELAISQGRATAVMSTEVMTGATPASFSAHADDRSDSSTILACQSKLMQEHDTIIEHDLNCTEKYQDIISDVLTFLDASETGFFLMYEEAYIDKYSHNNSLEGAFTCVVRFNQAIGLFMEYAFYHPDTMVLITADHETGALQFDGEGNPNFFSSNHTAADVPLFAYGYDAYYFKDFDYENIDIPKYIASLWGVNDFGQ